jgi:hypothetical protein
MSKITNLQKALKAEQRPPQAEAPKTPAKPGYMAPSRRGKKPLTAYLPPDYKANLRLIQARTGRSLQDLIAEALNDLYSKYDVQPSGRVDATPA